MQRQTPPQYSTALARRLRAEQTKAEELLWKRLRNRQVLGAKFRRQHPVGRYILDFFCQEHRLAIELDGSVHDHPEQKAYDDFRRKEIEADAINLMVFTNEEFLADPQRVIDQISDFLLQCESTGQMYE